MKILLGVCGGIAAYKAAELLRELQRRGADVQVVMTASAERFLTPLTFAALSGHQVLTSLWQPATSETVTGSPEAFDIEHIRVAQSIDAIVIAPASANTLARLAHGLGDDLLATICLASPAPLFLAPAMNVQMWHAPATVENMATLERRGAHLIAPDSGALACGMVGDGRLAEPSTIADTVFKTLQSRQDFAGETVLITAGGTREPIDAVRFLGNRSSGRMGFALAAAALARGARVILITGSVEATPPSGCERIPVTTAAEMQQAVLAHLPRATVAIMTAAVADYRVAQPFAGKLRKQPTLTLSLVANDDILKLMVAQRPPGTLLVGFAAQTNRVREEARRKLHEKGVDMIVANDVSQPDRGFGSESNAGTLLTRNDEIYLPLTTKRRMADSILDHVRSLRQARATLEQPV